MWRMNCLLCSLGTTWHHELGSTDLIALQEHLMDEHGYTQDDLRLQRLHQRENGILEYEFPDGKIWLRAWK
jgi:hypothetical protein